MGISIDLGMQRLNSGAHDKAPSSKHTKKPNKAKKKKGKKKHFLSLPGPSFTKLLLLKAEVWNCGVCEPACN